MQRRALMTGLLAASLAHPSRAADEPFDTQTVRRLARALADAPYRTPDTRLPDPFGKLSYDDYRQIRFNPSQALWRGSGLPFEAQFFHRGSIFQERVDMHEVVDGRVQPLPYRAEAFDFGPNPRPEGDVGWAGFRIHAPLNRADYADEVAVFLGATYFRAVAKGQGYGLSARTLGIKTADPGGEEFPSFRAFWLERPQPGTNSMVVTGLLDSPSTSGAARFTIRPGETTVIDVELTLYPRAEITQAGIGGMASMFLFDPTNRTIADDYRRAVHDSNGLQMVTGRGEELWRALANPRTLQVSSFLDASPRGFGLMQRARSLSAFEDLEARYEKRPSLWIEPIGDWGEGAVQLVEIPTKLEIHDNIVAQWRPKQPLQAKGEHSFTYRMLWGDTAPVRSELARFSQSRVGAGGPGARLFVLDVAGERLRLAPDAKPRAVVSADRGRIQNITTQPHDGGGWRIAFELLPEDNKPSELRAQLLLGDAPLSETWLYRWTA